MRLKRLLTFLYSIIFSFIFIHSLYSSRLLFIAVDVSKSNLEQKTFLPSVTKVINQSLFNKLKKGDYFTLVTFSDKTKMPIKKEIVNFENEFPEISKKLTLLRETGKSSGFFKMLYEIINNDYTSLPARKVLIIFTKKVIRHKDNEKYEKSILQMINNKMLKGKESKNPLNQIYLIVWEKLVNDKKNLSTQFYTYKYLNKKLNHIAPTQLLSLNKGDKLQLDFDSIFNKVSAKPMQVIKAEEMEPQFFSSDNTFLIYIMGGILIIIFTGFGIYLFIRGKAFKQNFYGYIEYYDEATTKPQKRILDLARLRKKEFSIGGRKNCDIFLRGSYNVEPMGIEAPIENKKEIKISNHLQREIHFVRQKKTGCFSNGDSFKIGTYILQYIIR